MSSLNLTSFQPSIIPKLNRTYYPQPYASVTTSEHLTQDSVHFGSQQNSELNVDSLLLMPPEGQVSNTHINNVRQALKAILTNAKFPPQLREFLLTQSDLKVGFVPPKKNDYTKRLEESINFKVDQFLQWSLVCLDRLLKKPDLIFNTGLLDSTGISIEEVKAMDSFKTNEKLLNALRSKAELLANLQLKIESKKTKEELFEEQLQPCFMPEKNMIIIPETVTDPESFSEYNGQSYTEVVKTPALLEKFISHELGHSLSIPRNFQFEADFVKSLEEEFDEFKDKKTFPIRHYAGMSEENLKDNYFDESQLMGDRFYAELWTELFSTRYANGGALNAEDVQKHFPESIQVIEKQINRISNSSAQ